jgi:leucyl-tRNA synthetase
VRQSKKIAKGKAATFDPKKEKKLTVYVAETYPAAQQKFRDIMQKHWEAEQNTDLKKVMPQVPKPEMKKAMPVLQALKKRLDLGESAERVFEKQLPFKETDVVREMIPGLRSKVLRLEVVEVVKMGEDGKGEVVAIGGKDELVAKAAAKVGDVVDGPGGDVTPGDPAFAFVNVEA